MNQKGVIGYRYNYIFLTPNDTIKKKYRVTKFFFLFSNTFSWYNTTDNAANMVGTVRDLGVYQFGCAAHTLQLTVRDSTALVEPLLERCRSIAAYFHRSPQATETLSKFNKTLNPDSSGCKIRIDVPTRWNSLLLMLKDIIKLHQPIAATLASLPSAKVAPLNETELNRVIGLEKLLGKLQKHKPNQPKPNNKQQTQQTTINKQQTDKEINPKTTTYQDIRSF